MLCALVVTWLLGFFFIITSSIETKKSVFLFFLFCAETGASVLHVHRLLSFFSPSIRFSHEYGVLTCYSPFETVRLAQEAEASLLGCVPLFFLPSFPRRPLPFSCPLFFFCSNKRAFILWGQSGSPLVHQVLRYQRDYPLLFARVHRGHIY